MTDAAGKIRERLLAWYDSNARALPWRIGPKARAAGEQPDPYRVWLSEVMLQQTTVPHAASYFQTFTSRWPSAKALAAAPESDVMAAWAGLGYYARARNLIACAREVADRLGGRFPDTEEALLALAGVGPYTAAAIAAIAFDRPANVVDGNVERVMARVHAVGTPLPGAKPELKRLAGALVTDERPGDWAQALMDLGAVICRPKAPLCERCPLAFACRARREGAPETYPRKTAKAERPRRRGAAVVLMCGAEVGLARRPPRGLLGGMLGLPTTAWGAARPSEGDVRSAAPGASGWRSAGEIEHVFTHFALSLEVWRATASKKSADLVWMRPEAAAQALPSVFRKALQAGLTSLL